MKNTMAQLCVLPNQPSSETCFLHKNGKDFLQCKMKAGPYPAQHNQQCGKSSFASVFEKWEIFSARLGAAYTPDEILGSGLHGSPRGKLYGP